MRKTHTKSRKGCANCKIRHIKCDETRPICARCDRMSLQCSFSSSSSPGSLSDESSSWSTIDLELIHHYATSSCMPLQPEPAKYRIWTDDLVKLALNRPYLLHQILAMSALHVFACNPTRTELIPIATKHRARALELIRPILTQVDEESCIPVFAFASFTSIYAFGELTVHLQQGSVQDPIDLLIHCFQLTLGIMSILGAYFNFIKTSWARPLIEYDNEDDHPPPELMNQFPSQMALLRDFIKTQEPRPDYQTAALEAIERVMTTIQIVGSRPDGDPSYSLISSWPIKVNRHFHEMLGARHPVALIILAHYAVMISLRPQFWWFKGWSDLLLDHVREVTGPAWSKILEWPGVMIRRTR